MHWSVALAVTATIVAVILATLLARRALRRSARRAVMRFRVRIDRFKLTGKPYIKAALLGDPAIAEAVKRHAVDAHLPKAAAWKRVERYVDEIVPFFNIIAYYQVGHAAARALLNLFYKPAVEYSDPDALRRVPRDAVVIYLMNHRSNADYVLVGYALSGQVAISYAVGEWARAFPLEYVFKSFGSYFIRRKYREPLYHTVLERYVQLITRNGVTQGIFPEGGLTRDGRLQPAKIGLLDYILGVAREPGFAARMYIVPVAINYDRVLEDRSLLNELAARQGGARPPKRAQLGEVAHYVGWNLGRLAFRKWRRYGRAAVTIGAPVALAPWFAEQQAAGIALFDLAKPERLARVQALADAMMSRIGALIPVTPVPLACAAIQSLGGEFVSRRALLERMAELRDLLVELNARVVRAEGPVEEIFDRAWRMLEMRRVLGRAGEEGFVVLPHGRPLVSYYANSIAHLLGEFEAAVRARDALPVERMGV